MDLLHSCRSAKFTKMSRPRLTHLWIELILVTLTLIGCIAPAAAPTPVPSTTTQTAGPPTTTPTSLPPTATPTARPPTTTPTTVQATNVTTPAFTLATSIKDIVGTWYNPPLGLYLRFYEDGLLHQSHSLDKLDTDPYAKCEIWFEKTQMYLKQKAVSGVPSCGDRIGIYKVRLYPEGNIQIVEVKDSCAPRAGDTALKLEPVR